MDNNKTTVAVAAMVMAVLAFVVHECSIRPETCHDSVEKIDVTWASSNVHCEAGARASTVERGGDVFVECRCVDRDGGAR